MIFPDRGSSERIGEHDLLGPERFAQFLHRRVPGGFSQVVRILNASLRDDISDHRFPGGVVGHADRGSLVQCVVVDEAPSAFADPRVTRASELWAAVSR